MAKQTRQVEPVTRVEVPPIPSGTTFGFEKLPSGLYLAVRYDGTARTVITPKRHGGDMGESKALAVQRALEEFGYFARRRDT